MYHLLIVDDEAHVVNKLAITIPWEQLKVQHVYEAYSGYEALDIVERVPVDIVITDITMPGMNGLELIKEIRKRNARTKCIILSGYSEFTYAKEAMVEGAVDYLLKPIDNQDLMEVVSRAVAQLEQEWELLLSHQHAMATLRANLPYMRGKLLHDLLQGARWSEQTVREKMEMLDLEDLTGKSVALMLVRLEGEALLYDHQDLSLLEYAVSNVAEEIFRKDFTVWHCQDGFKFSVFLLTPAHDQASDWQRAIERLATQLHEKVNQYLDQSISVLVSEWGTFPQELPAIYEGARFAFRQNIGSEKEMFMIVNDERRIVENEALKNLYLSPHLHDLLEIGQWDEASTRINLIFDELERKFQHSFSHIQEVYLNLYLSFSHIARKFNFSIFHEEFDILRQLQNGNLTCAEVREWAEEHLQRLKSQMNDELIDYRSATVRNIQQFIQDHICEDVSLQAISEHVHLHPSYISKIFKIVTGDTLSRYTMQVKMEQAQLLLKDTSLKVYEISERLGYKEPHSFIYAFKKYYKTTPMEYRISMTSK